MLGVVFQGRRELSIERFPDPSPGPGEAILEIRASGMCGSDLKFYRAESRAEMIAALGLAGDPEPVIAGHEPCGVVVAVGDGVEPAVARLGMRAMQHHYLGCGACPQCATGWSQLCDLGKATLYGSTAHGAHARFLRVPAKTLVPLPDGLSFEAGAAIACGTGTAWGALQRMGIKAEHTVAIFGQGPVGLSATQLARAMGARVIALDTSAERLQRALELGADLALDPRAADPVETIRESTRGLGADAALDTSAAPLARAQAVRCVRTWGEVCFVGEGDTVTLNVSGDLIRRQVTLRGSWAFSTVLQAACARFIADRQVPVDQLFTHRWPLEQAAEAYRIFDQQSAGKGVLLPAA